MQHRSKKFRPVFAVTYVGVSIASVYNPIIGGSGCSESLLW